MLTVDQLAKKLGIEIAEPKDRKKKVASILKKMNTYLKYTNFNFSFVKGDHERWAYTVLFSFPRHTLHYFDEGQYAVVVKKFYKNLLGLYVEIAYPDTDMAVRRKKIKEVEEDAGLYKEFLLWANSPESVEKKNRYISVISWLYSAGFQKDGHRKSWRVPMERKLLLLLKSSYLRKRTGR